MVVVVEWRITSEETWCDDQRGNWTSGTVLSVNRHEVDSGSCVQIRNLTQDGIHNMEYLPACPQTDAFSMCNLGVKETTATAHISLSK